jgi:hypothetical protein
MGGIDCGQGQLDREDRRLVEYRAEKAWQMLPAPFPLPRSRLPAVLPTRAI